MNYDAPLFRPPSEAYSLIIQITLGCPHNKCTFCSMYKSKSFRIKPVEEIKDDLLEARRTYKYVEKIFLADGDSLIIRTVDLVEILQTIKRLFPECKRIGTYGSPKALNLKTKEELLQLKENGLGIIYMGLESGNEEVLLNINKGVTPQEMVSAGKKVTETGIPLSITIISGLGGKEKFREHAKDTAKVLNQIQPDFLGLLTLLLDKDTIMYEQSKNGQFSVLNPKEVMLETKILLEDLELSNCVFRSNHASNFYPLKGVLPQDKNSLLNLLNNLLASSDDVFKSEDHRLL